MSDGYFKYFYSILMLTSLILMIALLKILIIIKVTFYVCIQKLNNYDDLKVSCIDYFGFVTARQILLDSIWQLPESQSFKIIG